MLLTVIGPRLSNFISALLGFSAKCDDGYYLVTAGRLWLYCYHAVAVVTRSSDLGVNWKIIETLSSLPAAGDKVSVGDQKRQHQRERDGRTAGSIGSISQRGLLTHLPHSSYNSKE